MSLGKWFPTSQRIVVPSSSGWRGPRYLCGYSSRTPWHWKQMHYDPSNCQEPLAQWHGIALKTASFNSHITMTVSNLTMNQKSWWIMKWKGWGRKLQWFNLRYYSYTCLKGLWKIKRQIQSWQLVAKSRSKPHYFCISFHCYCYDNVLSNNSAEE